jgi:hypothetical protein
MANVPCEHAVVATTQVAGLGGQGGASSIVECDLLQGLDNGQLPLVLISLYTKHTDMGFDAMTGTSPFQWGRSKRSWQDCPLRQSGRFKP